MQRSLVIAAFTASVLAAICAVPYGYPQSRYYGKQPLGRYRSVYRPYYYRISPYPGYMNNYYNRRRALLDRQRALRGARGRAYDKDSARLAAVEDQGAREHFRDRGARENYKAADENEALQANHDVKKSNNLELYLNKEDKHDESKSVSYSNGRQRSAGARSYEDKEIDAAEGKRGALAVNAARQAGSGINAFTGIHGGHGGYRGHGGVLSQVAGNDHDAAKSSLHAQNEEGSRIKAHDKSAREGYENEAEHVRLDASSKLNKSNKFELSIKKGNSHEESKNINYSRSNGYRQGDRGYQDTEYGAAQHKKGAIAADKQHENAKEGELLQVIDNVVTLI